MLLLPIGLEFPCLLSAIRCSIVHARFILFDFVSSIIDGGLTVARKIEEQVLRKEVDELESCLTNLNSPIVFCHNDILLHNVIYNEHTGRK